MIYEVLFQTCTFKYSLVYNIWFASSLSTHGQGLNSSHFHQSRFQPNLSLRVLTLLKVQFSTVRHCSSNGQLSIPQYCKSIALQLLLQVKNVVTVQPQPQPQPQPQHN